MKKRLDGVTWRTATFGVPIDRPEVGSLTQSLGSHKTKLTKGLSKKVKRPFWDNPMVGAVTCYFAVE